MHTIRLREPWEIEVSVGCVVYRRHFNRPTGLEQGDVVQLRFEPLSPDLSVRFNDEPLAENSTEGLAAWDITPQLQLRNSVTIQFAAATVPTQPPFTNVRLEILPANATPAK